MLKRLLAIALLLLGASSAFAAFKSFQVNGPGSGGGGGANLKAANVFGVDQAHWLDPTTYYVPGTGNPAISTADYYHLDGLYYFRPYDLLSADCVAAGASTAKGRYFWLASPDHPLGVTTWRDGYDFRAGYSNDPGVPPSRLETIFLGQIGLNGNLVSAPPVAAITASISATPPTLHVTALTGTISFDANAIVTGAGVAANTVINSQTSGTYAGIGDYAVSISQTVSSESMTVSQKNYVLYEVPYLVCNPDDISNPFYIYAEGAADRITHEEGYAKSPDLVNWTMGGPTHITPQFGMFTSFQRVVRDTAGSWHSTGTQYGFPAPGPYGNSRWTSSDGHAFPTPTSFFNVCLPPNSSGVLGSVGCTFSLGLRSNLAGAAPDTTTVSGQAYMITGLDTYAGGPTGDRLQGGSQWVARVPIDASFNALASPSPVLISNAYGGTFPGPTFLQAVNAYVEDGIAHYYAQVGFQSGSTTTSPQNPYLNGGGLWQQAIDYYTEVVDALVAVNAAPVGVTAGCASGTVTLSWYNALPNNTYRVYKSTDGGVTYPTHVDVTGTTTTDSPTAGSVYYYKVVTMNGSTEEKSRVVSTYASSSSAFVNAHITRVLAAGADAATINRTWLDTVDNWLNTNSLKSSLMLWTDVEFGVVQNASTHVISTIFDLGTTRLPRGGDLSPCGSECPAASGTTTYSATGLGGSTPAWVNSGDNAYSYYGGRGTIAIPGRINNIRRKTQITMFAAYQKAITTQITPLSMGEFISKWGLYHTAGTPGAVNFTLFDATQQKTATSAISGLATDFHTIAGTWDGTTLTAWADGTAGTGTQTGLVIPSPDLTAIDSLTGFVGASSLVPFLSSGSDGTKYEYGTGYEFSSGQAHFTGVDLIVFEKALTSTQMTSLDALIRSRP